MAQKSKSLSGKNNPLRAIDWRWKRVQVLANYNTATGRYPRVLPEDDSIIRRGRTFFIAYNRLKNMAGCSNVHELDIESLKNRFYDIYHAFEIYIANRAARWAIEAFVLADEPADTIAKGLGCDVSVINMYEALFFDIRDRLTADLFVMDSTLTPLISCTAGASDIASLWRGIGYWYGGGTLKAFMAVGKPSNELATSLRKLIEAQQQRNVVRAVFLRSINQYNAHDVVDEFINMGQLELSKAKLEQDNRMLQGDADSATKRTLEHGAQLLLNALSSIRTDFNKDTAIPVEEAEVKPLNGEKAIEQSSETVLRDKSADNVSVSKDKEYEDLGIKDPVEVIAQIKEKQNKAAQLADMVRKMAKK